MSLRFSAVLISSAVALMLATGAAADDRIRIGINSQQYGPSRAAVSARIDASREQERRTRRAPVQPVASRTKQPSGSARIPGEPTIPIAPDSPLLKNPQPWGPESFWYSNGSGNPCIYFPSTTAICYTVTAGSVARGGGDVTPAVLAAEVADRLDLLPGRIKASPGAAGLTGTDSWFWLSPPVGTRELSVSLAGGRVTVTAEPSVEWRFGDRGMLAGGSGVPYRPGAAPAEAILHMYEMRCLPGDRGRNPYVLASCGDRGYEVEALVHWRISFRASGRIEASGGLPARTTRTALVYPVTEARAFLNDRGSR